MDPRPKGMTIVVEPSPVLQKIWNVNRESTVVIQIHINPGLIWTCRSSAGARWSVQACPSQ